MRESVCVCVCSAILAPLTLYKPCPISFLCIKSEKVLFSAAFQPGVFVFGFRFGSPVIEAFSFYYRMYTLIV